MPILGWRKADPVLLALEAVEHLEHPEHHSVAPLTPSAKVTNELRQQQSLRASLQLVPEAHAQAHGGALERTASAKIVADKLTSKKRRRWLAAHQDAIDECSPRSEQSPTSTRSHAGSDEAADGATPVPDLHRLSVASFAVATAPAPEEYATLTQRQLRDMQADAAVAGMSRARTVYFRTTSLDWLFFLRNEHPLLSCLISHPLHPFPRHAHAKFLAVIVLFGVFTSVMTLHNVCKDQPPGKDCERKLDNWLYQVQIIQWALASAVLQLVMQTLAVCPCLQPGGTCACMCTDGCKVCCTKIGHEGLVIIMLGTALLTFVSIMISVHDDHIDTVNVLITTLEVKLRAFAIAFLILTLKFFVTVSSSTMFSNCRQWADSRVGVCSACSVVASRNTGNRDQH